MGDELFGAADFFLDAIQAFVDELMDIATLEANKVMVVRTSERFFISRRIVVESILGNQATILKEVEGVIDSSARNFLSAGQQPIVESFGIEVTLGFDDCIQDCHPCGC
jgi:hypothetical protein